MTGIVTPEREAILRVGVSGPTGRRREFDAVVDTGFNGFLALPRACVSALGLRYHSQATGTLADGSKTTMARYEVQIDWHGRTREVLALEVDGGPFLGMRLLEGNRMTVEIVSGGSLVIESMAG